MSGIPMTISLPQPAAFLRGRATACRAAAQHAQAPISPVFGGGKGTTVPTAVRPQAARATVRTVSLTDQAVAVANGATTGLRTRRRSPV